MEWFPSENRRGPPCTNRLKHPVETGIYEVNQRYSATFINICTVCDQQYVEPLILWRYLWRAIGIMTDNSTARLSSSTDGAVRGQILTSSSLLNLMTQHYVALFAAGFWEPPRSKPVVLCAISIKAFHLLESTVRSYRVISYPTRLRKTKKNKIDRTCNMHGR